jgi:Tol biopolymer transport system component
MTKQRILPKIVFILALPVMLLAACAPAEQFTQAEPTSAPTTVAVPPTAAPTQPAPTQPEPTQAAGETPAAPAPASGIAVYVAATSKDYENLIRVYSADGSLQYEMPIGSLAAPRIGQVQVLNNSVYIFDPQQGVLLHFARKLDEKLSSLPLSKETQSFLISPDEKRIAWVNLTTPAPGAFELWMANLDGSDAKLAVKYDLGSGAPLSLSPFRWTADGRLIYATIPFGIGGYILYDGYNSFSLYDPASGETQALSPADTNYGLCLEDVTEDLKTLVLHCQPGSTPKMEVGLLDIASGDFNAMPALPDQGAAGSAFISPTGEWLAYSVAKLNPDNEQGRVVVASLKGEPNPQVLQTVDGGYYTITGWLDADTLLFVQHANDGETVWRVGRDGSAPQKLADGQLLGLMN